VLDVNKSSCEFLVC